MENNSKLAIFDLDSITYIVAYKFRNKKAKHLVERATRKFIQEILTNIEATDYIGFYINKDKEAKPNFRYAISDTYKANRPPTPDFIIEWRPTIMEVYDSMGFLPVEGIESDDAVSITADKYRMQYSEVYIVTSDKDLRQIESTIFYNLNNHSIELIDRFAAKKHLVYQALMGDSADNIPGLPGIGKGKAATMLEEAESICDLYKILITEYKKYSELKLKLIRSKIRKEKEEEFKTQIDELITAHIPGLELNKAQMNRQIDILLDEYIKEEYAADFAIAAWRDYLKQQYRLVKLLVAEEAPLFDFNIPIPLKTELQDPAETLQKFIATDSSATQATDATVTEDKAVAEEKTTTTNIKPSSKGDVDKILSLF